jgi:hypothetical protein
MVNMYGVVIGHDARSRSTGLLGSRNGLPSNTTLLTVLLLSPFLLGHQDRWLVSNGDHVIGH